MTDYSCSIRSVGTKKTTAASPEKPFSTRTWAIGSGNTPQVEFSADPDGAWLEGGRVAAIPQGGMTLLTELSPHKEPGDFEAVL